MDQKILFELGDIQEELIQGIGIITTIEDGLATYTEHSSLTGPRAQAYVAAVITAREMLDKVSKRIQAVMDKPLSSDRERTAA